MRSAKLNFIITGLGLLVILASCKKDPPVKTVPFQTGKIQFTVNDNLTLKQVYTAIRSVIGDKEYELDNFYYTKVISIDSMLYYHFLFKNSPYISCFDVFKKPAEDFTRFRDVDFKNLNDANYQKWDSLVKNRSLIEMPNDGEGFLRRGMLTVPDGEERMWVNKLKQLPEIQSADLIFFGNSFD